MDAFFKNLGKILISNIARQTLRYRLVEGKP